MANQRHQCKQENKQPNAQHKHNDLLHNDLQSSSFVKVIFLQAYLYYISLCRKYEIANISLNSSKLKKLANAGCCAHKPRCGISVDPKKFPHFLHEGFGARIVPVAVFLVDFLEFAQQFLLTFGKPHGGFHDHMTQQVAMRVAAHALDSLAAQAKHLSSLRLCGNLDHGFAVKGGDNDFAAQRGGAETEGHFAMQIVALALEYGMLL